MGDQLATVTVPVVAASAVTPQAADVATQDDSGKAWDA